MKLKRLRDIYEERRLKEEGIFRPVKLLELDGLYDGDKTQIWIHEKLSTSERYVDISGEIKLKDIDTLIKTLQKAKKKYNR